MFCMVPKLDKMSTISHKESKDLNWLPVTTSFELFAISILFKFINGNCPYYLNEVFEFAPEDNVSLTNNFLKLKGTFQNKKKPVKNPYLSLVLRFGIKSQRH